MASAQVRFVGCLSSWRYASAPPNAQLGIEIGRLTFRKLFGPPVVIEQDRIRTISISEGIALTRLEIQIDVHDPYQNSIVFRIPRWRTGKLAAALDATGLSSVGKPVQIRSTG